VLDIPDYPQGMIRSGKVREELGIRSVIEEEKKFDELVILSAMAKDSTIAEALSMPGDEGAAWEAACQAEWKNMLDHNIVGPPEEPLPGMEILKTGMVC
jgi:hypothetical protein